jgi:hypothetical protein
LLAHAPPRKAEPIAFGRRSLPEIFAPPILKPATAIKLLGLIHEKAAIHINVH